MSIEKKFLDKQLEELLRSAQSLPTSHSTPASIAAEQIKAIAKVYFALGVLGSDLEQLGVKLARCVSDLTIAVEKAEQTGAQANAAALEQTKALVKWTKIMVWVLGVTAIFILLQVVVTVNQWPPA